MGLTVSLAYKTQCCTKRDCMPDTEALINGNYFNFKPERG